MLVSSPGVEFWRSETERSNPLSPPCIPPKFVLHGLSSKSKFLAVAVEEPFPGHDLRTEEVTLASLKNHSDAHFDKLIPSNGFSRHIFDKYSKTGSASWAKWCWTNQVDFTGVAWDDLTGGGGFSKGEITMITPLHGVIAHHTINGRGMYRRYRLASDPVDYPTVPANTVATTDTSDPFTVVYFRDRQGATVVRRIESYAHAPGCDLTVIKLDQPVPPSIKVYKILPAFKSDGEEIDWQIHLQNQEVLITLRERQCVWYKIGEVRNNGCILRFVPKQSVPMEYRIGNFNEKFRIVDSSGPSFIFLNGEPILVSLNWTTGSSQVPGPGDASFISSKLNLTRVTHLIKLLSSNFDLKPISLR